MMFLKWAALGPLSFLMAILGRILAPILPFFVQDDGYLPRWLWWFQTPDNSCDGDAGHWERHPGLDAWSTYKRRTAWFWRNVAYGFDLGFDEIFGVDVILDGLSRIGVAECAANVESDEERKFWGAERAHGGVLEREAESLHESLLMVLVEPASRRQAWVAGLAGWRTGH